MSNIHTGTIRVTINVSKEDLKFLNKMVEDGIFLSKTDCLRTLLRE